MAMLHGDDDSIGDIVGSGSTHGGHDGHSAHGNSSPNMMNVHSGHHMNGHGQGATMDHGDMMMSMFFHMGYKETILFSFWTINTVGGLIGSMIGIFLASMLYEGLKVFREYLLQRTLLYERTVAAHHHHHINTTNNGASGLQVPLASENGETPDGSAVIHPLVKTTLLRPHPFSVPHMLQSFLHMLQVFISYLLMLVFMTYNVWLALAVVLGAGAGYFLFGWRKKTIIDINEHCH